MPAPSHRNDTGVPPSDTKPIVSIVTPAYNAASYVGATIASVQAQEFRDWEMLVVDDCSKDNTIDVVRALAEHDPRVRLLPQAKNGGPAAARQRAVDEARGRYIAFLDSDDVWLPGKLERQLAFMQETGTALSFTAFRRTTEDSAVVGHLITVPDRLSYRGLLRHTAIATSTVIVDREKTGPFSMTRTYYDDYALWLELLARGHVARGLKQDLMRYRVLSRSVSRNKGRSAYHVWRVYREVRKLGLIDSAWCFANYALRAFFKYRRF